MNTNTRRILIRIFILVMLTAMAVAISPTMAHAKKKKKKTAKQPVMSETLTPVDWAGDYDYEVIANTASLVRVGKTTLSCSGSTSNIVFRAPKKKKYTFTFSNLRVFESESWWGYEHPDEYIQIEVVDGNLHQMFLKTQYGTDKCLQICTPEYMKEFPPEERASYTKLLSRYGKVLGRNGKERKMKRGEAIYFHLRGCSGGWAMDLQIK